ncbi:MAG: hypothetical protein HC880_01895 [Bacteroidia bacterium]|nr:hypothetical protein [Bacteroidia bacterium]
MIVIYSQMQYAKEADLGFDKEAIVMIPLASPANSAQAQTLKNQFSHISGVENVSMCFTAPSSQEYWGTSIRFEGRTEDEIFKISHKAGDAQYVSTFDLKLIYGLVSFMAIQKTKRLVSEKYWGLLLTTFSGSLVKNSYV